MGMKLDLLNDSTAIDKKGIVWFKFKITREHSHWVTCSECGKRTNDYWKSYPDCGIIVCDKCREDL
jgi:predicted RNA-binding Zn-ribbon protein involved in translation (DUF1610 family)